MSTLVSRPLFCNHHISSVKFANYSASLYLCALFLLFCLIPAPSAFAQATLGPATISFGNLPVGEASVARNATLRNTQKVPLTIASIAVSGGTAPGDFSWGGTCPITPLTLGAGKSCVISVTLTPSALGTRTATLTVTDSASNSPQSIALTGTGISPIPVSPASLTFPTVIVGTTSPARTVTLVNHLDVGVAFSSIATSGDFAIASNGCGFSVGPGSKCTIGVTFSPTVPNLRQGALTIDYSAFGSPSIIALSGTGSEASLSSITVTPANPSIVAGATLQFTATGHFQNGRTQNLTSDVTWNSSATGVATIVAGGLATSVGPGTSNISATLGSTAGLTTLTVTTTTFTIGGTVSGLAGTGLVLQNNGGNNLPVNANGSFTFTTPVASGGTYDVTVLTQPSNPVQSCGTTNAIGTANANVTNVSVICPFTALVPVMTTIRVGHTATLLPDGTVLVTGGINGQGAIINTAELYDPSAQTFTPLTATMTSVRTGHTATLLPNGLVLITGGSTGSDGSGNLDTAELYDPAAQTFTPLTATMASVRSSHTATLLPNGTVLITGGFNDTITAFNTAEIYDPTAQTFTALTATMTSTRAGHTATLLNDGQVLLAGGFNNSNATLNTAELYNPTGNTFTALSVTMTSTRNLHTATLLPDGSVLITGGSSSSHNNPALNTAETYDPVADIFTALPETMTIAREAHSATLLPSGIVLLAGGATNPFPTGLNTTEAYDPEAGN
jgi:N-acetylneuraminic acid mutarotase